jgi:hypothetical protein
MRRMEQRSMNAFDVVAKLGLTLPDVEAATNRQS